jgi:hypothetical protein
MKLLGTLEGRAAAAAALLALAAQPCAAAGDPRDMGATVTRTGAFAGATVRLDLSGRSAAKPSARLQLGMTQTHENSVSPALSRTTRGAVLELGASDRGAPVLFVGGQKMKDLKTRAGLQSSTGTILVVLGAVAAAAVLLTVVAADGDDEDCGADEWFC